MLFVLYHILKGVDVMTVTELARLTGYSISTVSKALSDSGEIGAEAKERILRAAKETGYYDKAVRRRKRIGMPQTVGIVTSDIRDSSVLSRLCRALRERGFSPVVSDAQNAVYILSQVLGVDALIFSDGSTEECTVPYSVYRGSADNAADEIVSLLRADGAAAADKKTERKEDIWLF